MMRIEGEVVRVRESARGLLLVGAGLLVAATATQILSGSLIVATHGLVGAGGGSNAAIVGANVLTAVIGSVITVGLVVGASLIAGSLVLRALLRAQGAEAMSGDAHDERDDLDRPE